MVVCTIHTVQPVRVSGVGISCRFSAMLSTPRMAMPSAPLTSMFLRERKTPAATTAAIMTSAAMLRTVPWATMAAPDVKISVYTSSGATSGRRRVAYRTSSR